MYSSPSTTIIKKRKENTLITGTGNIYAKRIVAP
jgi:hypothetical protein